MQQPSYEVVWPLGKSAYSVASSSLPLADLSGKTIAELSNYLFRVEEVFPLLRKSLGRRYPGIKFVDADVFGNVHGPGSAERVQSLPALLRDNHIDGVIAGLGA
jgi:hypothetical protein